MFKDVFPFSEFSSMDVVSPMHLSGRSYSPVIGLFLFLKSEIATFLCISQLKGV